jgi:hypothetical protein
MLDQKKLQEILDYCPVTGTFTWKIKRQGIRRPEAGVLNNNGYWIVKIDGRPYRRARLVWFYVHGRWPIEEIDHINMNKLDDRIGNLREATRSQNIANAPKRSNNSSGYKGVSLKQGKWIAVIDTRRIGGTRHHLGCFSTPQEAHLAYKNAACHIYGPYARY